jgi:hypothetical protein
MSVFQLQVPVVVGEGPDSTTVREIELRRPKVKDLRAANKYSDIEYIAFLVECLGNVPKAVVDEIAGADFLQLQEVVEGFLEPGQTTGKNG